MTPYFSLITPALPPRPVLRGEHACDVLVIGGGVCGILTAHLLAQRGLDVTLLEADHLLSGQTRGTTAKVTAQHGLFAAKLIRTAGMERARLVVRANLEAVRALGELAGEIGPGAEFEAVPAFLYTLENPRLLEEEAEACARLSLPVTPTRELPAPIRPAAALKLGDQAQMNPLALLGALAGPLHVCEHSRVLQLDGLRAMTAEGSVRAGAIVVCTHSPMLPLAGGYFLRLYQQRAYVLALRTSARVEGALYGAGAGGYSLRSARDAVFFGGESHRCGDAKAAGGAYDRLRRAAAKLFPDAQELAHWSAQDCMTPDGVPYVGAYSARLPGVYVATGFGKWGMTGSMAAAQILADALTGRENAFAAAFSPQRPIGASAAGALLRQTGHACAGLGASALPPPLRTAESLAPGEGAIVRDGLRRLAAYRDEEGALHACSPCCAHLRCQLTFNAAEKSWDCPCHGSRFDVDGHLLCGPAQRDQPHAGH